VADDKQMELVPQGQPETAAPAKSATPLVLEEGEHYEQISEYRIGEGAPPLALIVMFILIVLWATLSWIPFFGY
jgi:hypothetical protein